MIVHNPHPLAYCPNCEKAKPCVGWEACSVDCASILGFSTAGLPSREAVAHERLRAMGYVKGPWIRP